MRGFGELEAAIMDVIWSAGRPMLVREVLERLRRERSLAYTTVQTVMEILLRKGWLDRRKSGRAYQYVASRSREDYTAGLMDEVLATAPDRTAALVRLFEQMDPAEVTDLRAALEQVKASGPRP